MGRRCLSMSGARNSGRHFEEDFLDGVSSLDAAKHDRLSACTWEIPEPSLAQNARELHGLI
jgi:hypothetical protein